MVSWGSVWIVVVVVVGVKVIGVILWEDWSFAAICDRSGSIWVGLMMVGIVFVVGSRCMLVMIDLVIVVSLISDAPGFVHPKYWPIKIFYFFSIVCHWPYIIWLTRRGIEIACRSLMLTLMLMLMLWWQLRLIFIRSRFRFGFRFRFRFLLSWRITYVKIGLECALFRNWNRTIRLFNIFLIFLSDRIFA